MKGNKCHDLEFGERNMSTYEKMDGKVILSRYIKIFETHSYVFSA